MCFFAYASVPLYNIFCKATGYGGTTKQATHSSSTLGLKTITVKFDANIENNLKWVFKPEQSQVQVKPGENVLVFYSAENLTNQAIIGTAIYNVSPGKIGQYFNKIQCFCFEEQLLLPGQKVMMPVTFFIDPSIEQDKNAQDVTTITLSYTFFRVPTK